MKEIQLTQGKVALVDDEDFEWLNQWKWCAQRIGYTFYAVRGVGGRKNRVSELMHRIIMKTPSGLTVDHLNGIGTDNQKANLRNCTYSENLCGHRKINGFRGVSYFKRDKNYSVGLSVNGKRIHIGYYKTELEAAKAYNDAALKYRGKFAVLNVIPEEKTQC